MDTQKNSNIQQKLHFCQQDVRDIINKIDLFTNELPSAWRGAAANRFQEILLCQRNELEMLGEDLSSLAEIESQVNLVQMHPKQEYSNADDG